MSTKITDENDFTICRYINDDVEYLISTNPIEWDKDITKCKIFENKNEAKTFGNKNCKDFKWNVFATSFTITHIDEIITEKTNYETITD